MAINRPRTTPGGTGVQPEIVLDLTAADRAIHALRHRLDRLSAARPGPRARP